MQGRPLSRFCRLAGGPFRLHTSRRLACSSLPPRVAHLLKRTDWLLSDPAVQITPVHNNGTTFSVIRDDLTHPLLGGNKFRKLDGLWGSVAQASDIVTCGGLQSAHTVAVAAASAERGKRCHLLVRGEQPAVPTGHHLYARMLAHRVEYVSRSMYADRDAMFAGYLAQLQQQAQEGEGEGAVPLWPQQQQFHPDQLSTAGAEAPGSTTGPSSSSSRSSGGGSSGSRSSGSGSASVAVIPEGAACSAALLGLVRLVAWLAEHPGLEGEEGRSQHSRAGSFSASVSNSSSGGDDSSDSSSRSGVGVSTRSRRCHIVVDCGTGATATGLALGAALLGLPWRVTGVMLAGPLEYYQGQQQELVAAFCVEHWAATAAGTAAGDAAGAAADVAAVQQGMAERLRWVPRCAPRKFGKVLPGEVAACRAVAQQQGILLDPIWSLAAWEVACQLATAQLEGHSGSDSSGSGSRSGGEISGGIGSIGSDEQVLMLHTGGMLGLCGLAQRMPDQF